MQTQQHTLRRTAKLQAELAALLEEGRARSPSLVLDPDAPFELAARGKGQLVCARDIGFI